MALTLYELAAKDPEVRFSPHCWKIRMALAHKGLVAETIPWRFTEKEKIAFSEQGKVPVLVHDDEMRSESWPIALYLEDIFDDEASLFRGDSAKSMSLFFNHWADMTLIPAIAPLIMSDVYNNLADIDLDYFRQTREAAIGQTLEEFSAAKDVKLESFRSLLTPLRATLQAQPFLAGEKPNYADYCVFGAFMWARCISRIELLKEDDPVAHWRTKLLNVFDGMAENAPRCG